MKEPPFRPVRSRTRGGNTLSLGRAAWYLALLLVCACAGHATTAADYRRLADSSVASGQYAKAANYYRSEAEIYRKQGDPQAAEVEEDKANRWTTHVQMYFNSPADPRQQSGLATHARFEPTYGCYLGGYAEADDRLDGMSGADGSPLPREAALGEKIGKHLATAFTYSHYGEHFPLNWAQALLKQNIAPHIALEPNDGLDAVQDNDYLRQFAADAASCKGPIFLRFAAEMNGDWTNYHNNPALYRQKFKLVHDVMARLAPNVAMIWCVNEIPKYNIDDYYPGDDSVDWVGVNFYSVIHHDNDASRPADFEDPGDMLQYVYDRYAARKPIAICEYGASHREKLNPDMDRSDVAAVKLAQLYAALPRRFPRVKLIDIFDCNNLEHARPGRQLNDYSITDSETVLAAFRKATSPDYFLSTVADGDPSPMPAFIQSLSAQTSLSGNVRLSASVKTYEARPTVIYALDGKEIGRVAEPGDYGIDLDTSQHSQGRHLLSVVVQDSHGTESGRQELAVTFAPASKAPATTPETGASNPGAGDTAGGATPGASAGTSATAINGGVGKIEGSAGESGSAPARPAWMRFLPASLDLSTLLVGVVGLTVVLIAFWLYLRGLVGAQKRGAAVRKQRR